MKIKKLLLTLLFTTSAFFPFCEDPDPFDCDCPPLEGAFFDIKGATFTQYRTGATENLFPTGVNEKVTIDEYFGFGVEFDVDFVSQKCPHSPGFSLINTAYACSCDSNGARGSKEESLKSITIYTLNDFDAAHPANTRINELFEISVGGPRPFSSYLSLDNYLIDNQEEKIRSKTLYLKLKHAPDSGTKFKARIVLRLSTGEAYEYESKTVIF